MIETTPRLSVTFCVAHETIIRIDEVRIAGGMTWPDSKGVAFW